MIVYPDEFNPVMHYSGRKYMPKQAYYKYSREIQLLFPHEKKYEEIYNKKKEVEHHALEEIIVEYPESTLKRAAKHLK
jgi:hypothetical protein